MQNRPFEITPVMQHERSNAEERAEIDRIAALMTEAVTRLQTSGVDVDFISVASQKHPNLGIGAAGLAHSLMEDDAYIKWFCERIRKRFFDAMAYAQSSYWLAKVVEGKHAAKE